MYETLWTMMMMMFYLDYTCQLSSIDGKKSVKNMPTIILSSEGDFHDMN